MTPQGTELSTFASGGIRKYALAAVAAAVIAPALVLAAAYFRFAPRIDHELTRGLFAGSSDIYSAVPPRLMTNVSPNREHRRIVSFDQIPPRLVHAVISAEDKRFFHHPGIDPLRMLKAAYRDLKHGRKSEGASTITMQLARSLWLGPQKMWQRKLTEIAMALRLEEKMTKQQIFTGYCNQVYLGRRGTFSLHGFGAAAKAYLDKDLADLSLPEAAMLAGLIQRPSYYHPLRAGDLMRDRRNVVLSLMRRNGYIGEREYREALQTPIRIAANPVSSGEPYFMDLVNEEVQEALGDTDQGRETQEVYTTVDIHLQQAANDAIRMGMRLVDEQLRKRSGGKGTASPAPQVALVAMDPHTGDVKALVGGRDYGASQLNRAVAERQPGSVFKPFVYAAALNSALTGGNRPVITAATMISDDPTGFWFQGALYQPGNFGHEDVGEVSVREAMRKSLNVPAVRVAEMTGYGAVADLARRAGLGDHIQATPSLALGSYEATPLGIAGAYTIFANEGVYVRPNLVSQIKTRSGKSLYRRPVETRQVLDPRVAFLTENLMEDVVNSGTGYGVRARGFRAPAAGKTGTSHDGWFAGFTSKLLCVVWVGFDDNSDLKLEGSKSALPIWTEFMKRATEQPLYHDVQPFRPPRGITSAVIDPETGLLATANCGQTRSEYFIAGAEPQEMCPLHGRAAAAPASLSSR
ncbi:MAG TPA: PBP1A family penicillin-binding protein [Bryobacteraceae bacterium]|nr:PBP1A family penicillin-binding protein [Bryobacteraceae bacterium]